MATSVSNLTPSTDCLSLQDKIQGALGETLKHLHGAQRCLLTQFPTLVTPASHGVTLLEPFSHVALSGTPSSSWTVG